MAGTLMTPHGEPLPEYILAGAGVFDGDDLQRGHAVHIREGRVEAVAASGSFPQDIPQTHIPGAIIAPGFVDVQLNGCGGVFFNDAVTPDTLRTMHAANILSGCTSFLPTLITAPEETMLAAMETVRAFRKTEGGDAVIGLHLEGPYINPKKKGIHDERHITALSPEMREKLADFARTTPLMLTLAPECVEAEDIRILADAGVVVSIGHSAASYEEAKRGIAAGAKAATHLFNGMTGWEGRAPGMVGAILDSPEVACGMIADGHHVHTASLALAKRIKGEQCFLVTDATAAVGTDMREFTFGGQTVYVRNGTCRNADGTLGGSMLTMVEAVRNSVHHVGIPLEETLRMAALYPARLMGRNDLGRIAPGLPANLALLSQDAQTFVGTVSNGTLFSA